MEAEKLRGKVMTVRLQEEAGERSCWAPPSGLGADLARAWFSAAGPGASLGEGGDKAANRPLLSQWKLKPTGSPDCCPGRKISCPKQLNFRTFSPKPRPVRNLCSPLFLLFKPGEPGT
jgi:hypothetical protein